MTQDRNAEIYLLAWNNRPNISPSDNWSLTLHVSKNPFTKIFEEEHVRKLCSNWRVLLSNKSYYEVIAYVCSGKIARVDSAVQAISAGVRRLEQRARRAALTSSAIYTVKKLEVDLTLKRSSQLQSGFIQVQVVVQLLLQGFCNTPFAIEDV